MTENRIEYQLASIYHQTINRAEFIREGLKLNEYDTDQLESAWDLMDAVIDLQSEIPYKIP